MASEVVDQPIENYVMQYHRRRLGGGTPSLKKHAEHRPRCGVP